MSDRFEMLIDVEATPSEAEVVAGAVLARFRELGLITGSATPDCVLGGTGYRPGPAVADSYQLGDDEHPFWKLVTCGVEPQVGRSFNEWALGASFEGFVCSACHADIDPFDEAFGEAISQAICEWMEESGPTLVPCPECQKMNPITEWQCTPPLGFGNLSFRFWNWPPLQSSSWKIDVAEIVREATGHSITTSYGHL